MPEIDNAQLYAAIREQMDGKSEILGSQLGAFIRTLDPSIDIKGTYQNLRNFVATHLSDVLKNVGKRGGDDIYSISGPPGYKPLDGESSLLWSAFSNPNRHGRIFYCQEGGPLLFSDAEGLPQPSEECQPFQKLTVEDYRRLAETLITTKVPDDIQPEAQEMLTKDGFWERLTNHLRKHGHHLEVKEFEAERIRFVESEFKRHAIAVGMPEELIPKWIDALQKSRQFGNPKKQKMGVNPSPTHGSAIPAITQAYDPKTQTQDLVSMRNLIKLAIDRMDLEELRSLRLPVGVILDAFRHH